MNSSLQEDNLFSIKFIIPFLTILFLIIMMVLPYQFKIIDNSMPFLSLIGVYYWSVFKKDLLPISAIFVLGIIQDIILGSPLGLTSLLLIIAQQFIFFQGRNFLERGFLFNFFIFILMIISFGFLSWGISSLYVSAFLGYWEVILQILLTIAFYPIIILILNLATKR